jgi:predicted cupin superfamily sugar epimerase
MTAAEVIRLLNLSPHPTEGGQFLQTYAAAERIELPGYPSPRRTSTAIYYLLEPHTFSEMHRLRSDEIFHFYAGDALEMLQLAEGQPGERIVLGNDLAQGQRPQVLAPRNVWQGSRILPGGRAGWSLVGCTVSPGFEYEDYETGVLAQLLAQWPQWSELIVALTHER